jgi:putative restriction endonuclease
VFCGLKPAAFGAARMLLAGHIKPWKDSTPAERLDLRNGLAACPAHDVAFDTGLLTFNGGLRIHLASRLTDAVQDDPLARQYYGRPPLQETLLLPPGAQAPPASISIGTGTMSLPREGSSRGLQHRPTTGA